jgi:tetratricopeptide (TPR) repeat protein
MGGGGKTIHGLGHTGRTGADGVAGGGGAWRRRGAALLALVTAGAALVLGGGLLGRGGADPVGPAGPEAVTVAEPGRTSDALADAIRRAQQRLRDVPGDWVTWAGLGAAYVEQARLTGDPSYYPRADGALTESLRRRPGNSDALTGQAQLAAARHDFAAALALADRAVAANPHGAAGHGVRGDALVELGRYDEADRAFQRMVDLRPGVASFTRASYAFELRGDLDGARYALEQALSVAYRPVDAAFSLYHLGELDWQQGRLGPAEARYAAGLVRDPRYLPNLAGRAKVRAARGDLDGAVADYRAVVARLPLPEYLVAFGDLLAAHGRDAEARRHYDLVRTQQRLARAQGVVVDLEVALFAADNGDPAAALTAAAAELDRRRSIHVEDAYAWALHAAGRDAEALPYARRALRLGTASALFHYHLGVIEAGVGHRTEAVRELRRALSLNPQFSPRHVPEARRLLADLEQG